MSAGLPGVGEGVLQRLDLVVEVSEAAAAGDGFVEHRPARHLLDVLPEIADRQALGDQHLALVRGLLAHDHPEQGGLARPVRADEADLLSRVELEGGIDEEHLPPVLLSNARKRNHGNRPA